MSQAHLCSECGDPHVVQNAHRESLTKIKCHMLKKAGEHVIETGVNNFKKKDVQDMTENSAYGNFQKLRYHGLIARVKPHRDRWLITRNGWAFLRGDVKLPKYVMVKDNHTQQEGRSDVLVGLIDVLRGGDYLETTFDYFDHDTGEMIPKKAVYEPEQAALL